METYKGKCRGGPMDRQVGESRFPKGFVLIDKPNSIVWVYDYDENTEWFTAREMNTYNYDKHMHAAEGSNYDVRALDVSES